MTISTLPPTQNSMNFALLREEGLKLIEKLSSQLWTDYNSHDPGITILEVLCYAITDLGYRTDYDIKDLLASYTGSMAATDILHTADVILPNHPLSVKDYRKLLIDHQDPTGIRRICNAWLVKTEEPEQDVFLDETGATLTFARSFAQVPLNGLYEVQLKFLDDLTQPIGSPLRDLNAFVLKTTLTSNGRDYPIEVVFPYWEEVPEGWRTVDFNTVPLSLTDFFVLNTSGFDEYHHDYAATLQVAGLDDISIFVRKVGNIKDTFLSNIKTFLYEAIFVDWHEVASKLATYPTITQVQITSFVNEMANSYQATLSVSLSDGTNTIMVSQQLQLNILTEIVDTDIRTDIETQLQARINFAAGNPTNHLLQLRVDYDAAVRAKILESGTGSLIQDYQAKLVAIQDIIFGTGGIQQTLWAKRNLCEDFVHFKASREQEIAICGDFILAPGYTPNEVMVEIFFKIDQYLEPIVNFKSLQEMLDEGFSFEDMFEGPRLTHGFITDESLEVLDLRDSIFASDLINLIMSVEGVIAVKGFRISNYVNGQVFNNKVENCIKLHEPNTYRPKLSIEKSIYPNFSSSSHPLPLDTSKVQMKFDEKKQAALEQSTAATYSLSVPKGSTRNIATYHSLQNDFPELYGIGEAGLPDTATTLRQAQAQQLKAYLLFFEQLLTDYLAQLSRVKELFSIDAAVLQTYNTQGLYDIPNIAPLYKDFIDNYTDWNTFTSANNAYATGIQTAVESPAVFLDRRNRFLDHLTARFAENFNEYALHLRTHLLYTTTNDEAAAEAEAKTQLIANKIKFLANYPDLSSNRSQAFNYKLLDTAGLPDVWDSDNVSGLKKRISCLLGIENYQRRKVFFADITNYVGNDGMTYYRFTITDDSQVTLLFSVPYTKENLPKLYTDLEYVLAQASMTAAYQTGTNGTNMYYYITDQIGIKIARSEDFTSLTDMTAAKDAAVTYLTGKNADDGFHIIEHILLRPKIDTQDQLLKVSTTVSGQTILAQRAPYSFRISVLLPTWTTRFRDPCMREFIERTIRMETPAHIYAEIYWLDAAKGCPIENAYKAWLEQYALNPINPTALQTAQNNLITLLDAIRL